MDESNESPDQRSDRSRSAGLRSRDEADDVDEALIHQITTTMELGRRRQPPLPSASAMGDQSEIGGPQAPELDVAPLVGGEIGKQAGPTPDPPERRQLTEDFIDANLPVGHGLNQVRPPDAAGEPGAGISSAVWAAKAASDSEADDQQDNGLATSDGVPQKNLADSDRGVEASSAVRAARAVSESEASGPRDDALHAGSAARMMTPLPSNSRPPEIPATQISQPVGAEFESTQSPSLSTVAKVVGYGVVVLLALVGMAALGYLLASSGLFG